MPSLRKKDNEDSEKDIFYKTIKPNTLRKNLYKIIDEINRDYRVIYVKGSDDSKSAVLLSKKGFDAFRETYAVLANGQLAASLERENDEFVDIDTMIQEIEGK